MQIIFFKKTRLLHIPFILWILIVISLSACSGGGSSGDSSNNDNKDENTETSEETEETPELPKVTITGIVEKGPFVDLNMNAYGIGPDGNKISYQPQVNGSEYQIEVLQGQPVVLEATGTFTNELTGEPVTLEQPLRAVTFPDGAPQNINVFTDLIAARVLGQFADGFSAVQLQESEQNMMGQLGLSPDIDPGGLRMNNINDDAELGDPSLQLLLFSAFILELKGEQLGLGDAYKGLIGQLESGLVDKVGGFFTGVDPVWLYERMVIAEQIPNLPEIQFSNRPVLICEIACQWLSPNQISYTLRGTDAREVDGKLHLQVVRGGYTFGEVPEALSVGVVVSDVSTARNEDYLGEALEVEFSSDQRIADLTIDLIIDKQTEVPEQITFEITDLESSSDSQSITSSTPLTVNIYDDIPITNAGLLEPDSLCIISIAHADETILYSDLPQPIDNACQASANPASLLNSAFPLLRLGVGLNGNCGASCTDQLLSINLTKSLQNENDEVIDRIELGQYLYPGSAVTNSTGNVNQTLVVALSDPTVVEFLQQALIDEQEVTLAIENTQLTNEAVTLVAPDLLLLPDEIQFGDRTLTITEQEFDSTTECIDSVAVTAQFVSVFNDEVEGTEISNAGSVCVVFDENGRALVTNGEVAVEQILLELPPWHYLRVEQTGTENAKIKQADGLEFLLWVQALTASTSFYLGVEELPFIYKITAVHLTSQGLRLSYSGIQLKTTPYYYPGDTR
ncbi:MAG: hypothetical protein P1U57_13225, partial [Oleibacter sp.]|nr:hypothetical protein [Thalassolituus sp.]